MPTAQKAEAIQLTKERFDKSVGVIFTEYRGLKVSQLQTLRSNLGQKGGEFHIVKNTLFRQAAGDAAASLPEELGSGPTAVAFVYSNESDCAKAVMDFSLTNKALVVKGGMFGGKVFDAKGIEALSKLPPRDVLIAQVIGAIAAPLSNLVGVVEALYADPIRVIGAVADKVAEGSPIVEKASSSSPESEVSEPAPEAPAEEPAAAEESAPAEADAPSTEEN